jgi:hypothetical protein
MKTTCVKNYNSFGDKQFWKLEVDLAFVELFAIQSLGI